MKYLATKVPEEPQLQTGKAWAYKEMLRDLWGQNTAASSTSFFNDWYRRVIHTKLEPLKAVANPSRRVSETL